MIDFLSEAAAISPSECDRHVQHRTSKKRGLISSPFQQTQITAFFFVIPYHQHHFRTPFPSQNTYVFGVSVRRPNDDESFAILKSSTVHLQTNSFFLSLRYRRLCEHTNFTQSPIFSECNLFRFVNLIARDANNSFVWNNSERWWKSNVENIQKQCVCVCVCLPRADTENRVRRNKMENSLNSPFCWNENEKFVARFQLCIWNWMQFASRMPSAVPVRVNVFISRIHRYTLKHTYSLGSPIFFLLCTRGVKISELRHAWTHISRR